MKKPEPQPLTLAEKLIFLIPIFGIVLTILGGYLAIRYNIKITFTP